MMTRREHLAALAGAATLSAAPPDAMSICAFSKHFQWTDVKEMSDICASIGYEGIDLTLRKGGHVLPERVADDLPKAAETIRKAGLKLSMVTTEIVDARTPHAEAIARTLKSLGVRHYRFGDFRYDEKRSVPDVVAECKTRIKDLEALNKQYGVCAMYHTHSGIGRVGASFWDLYLIFKDYDANAVSVNYDVGHATVEGGYGGWINSSRLLMPHIRGVAVKDFAWRKNEKGAWVAGWCALGQGMVNFKRFLPMLKAADFRGPLQLHMEYPELGGADTGRTQFSIPKDKLLAIFKRDLDTLKGMLKEAGLRA